MPRGGRWALLLVAVLTGVVACDAAPDGPPLARRDAPLIGGAASSPCGWSGAALLIDEGSGTLCSGVLLHPRVVAFAGHCGEDFDVVRFGTGDVRRAIRVARDGDGGARCFRHPRCTTACEPEPSFAGDPWDYALCILEGRMDDAAVIPPAMGCEVDEATERDRRVWAVGFGADDFGMSGAKNELEMRVDGTNAGRNEVVLETLGGGEGLCVGDSGGPTYVELDDGSWRVLSVHHATDAPCGRGLDRVLADALPWVEDVTGFDLTPCHDADGTWRPSAACGRFPADPGGDHGTFPSCTPGPLADAPSQTCGPPFGPGGGDDDDDDAGDDDDDLDGGVPSGGRDAGFFIPDPIDEPRLEGGCAAVGAPMGGAPWAAGILLGLARARRRRR